MQKSLTVARIRDEIPFVTSPPLMPSIPAARDEPRHRRKGAIEVYVDLRNVTRVLRDLIPFYGPSCATSVFELMGDVEVETLQGTLEHAQNWTVQEISDRPVLLMVG